MSRIDNASPGGRFLGKILTHAPTNRRQHLSHMSTPEPPREASGQRLRESGLVGKGFTSDVYAWGEGRVLKVFHAWVPAATVKREFRLARAVYAAGIPTPAVFDLVEIKGRLGIVFERVDGPSMLTYTQARPWTLFRVVRQLAELQAQIHGCPAPLEIPTQRDWIAHGIAAAPDSSTAEKEAALRCLAGLPDGTALCHGDFHPENVILSARGPVVIDWTSATRGDPLGDVACTSRLIQNAGLPPWTPRYMHILLQCSRTFLHRAYLQRSLELHAGTRQQIAAWQAPLAVAAKSWRVPGTPNPS